MPRAAQSQVGSGTRQLVLAVLPTAGFLVLVFALGELALRARFDSIEQIAGVGDWRPGRFGDLVYTWDAYHPRTGWTNRPGYRSDAAFPFRLSLNAQGLRGPEDTAPQAAPGVRRIAVFGDSTVFGEEVDDDETLPAFLGETLPGTEVLNFGVHGFGLGQMVLRLEEEGFALRPHHVVVVLMLPWALYRDPVPFFVHAKPVFRVEDAELVISNVPVPERARLPWLTRHSFVAAWLLARPRVVETARGLDGQLETTRLLLQRAAAGCAQRGIGLSVVAISVAAELEAAHARPRRSRVSRRMRDALEDLGLDFLDLVPFVEATYAEEGADLAMPQGHWSARANCLIAARVAAHLGPAAGSPSCPPR